MSSISPQNIFQKFQQARDQIAKDQARDSPRMIEKHTPTARRTEFSEIEGVLFLSSPAAPVPLHKPIDFNEGIDVFKKTVGAVVVVFDNGGEGAGVIVDRSGLVVTNWHVVKGNKRLAVMMKPKGKGLLSSVDLRKVRVIEMNVRSDLALLQILDPPLDITAIPMADLEDVEVAMDVHIIGHPFGEAWSYARGTVSQVRPRYIWTYEDIEHLATVIQTTAPINRGNSGGPLLSNRGKLLGINSFFRPDSKSINFSIGINHVKELLSQKKPEENPGEYAATLDLLRAVDRDNNGVVDAWEYDTNGNGVTDRVKIDSDEDGLDDYWLWDTDENGKFETKATLFKRNDGVVWVVLTYDVDEDGVCDYKGLDKNLDGLPDALFLC